MVSATSRARSPFVMCRGGQGIGNRRWTGGQQAHGSGHRVRRDDAEKGALARSRYLKRYLLEGRFRVSLIASNRCATEAAREAGAGEGRPRRMIITRCFGSRLFGLESAPTIPGAIPHNQRAGNRSPVRTSRLLLGLAHVDLAHPQAQSLG